MNFFFKHKKLIVFVILFTIGLAIYGNSFNNEFFWDDDDSIVNNVYIKDWQYFDKYFTENLIAGSGQTTNYWRPVLLISFAMDYHLWGLEPFGFHLTNTLFHALAAWLVFLLLYKLARMKRDSRILPSASFFILPFLVSLFFLIHPLQTEAVTYVAGRADSLSGIFSLLAILFYIKARERNKNILKEQSKIWLLSNKGKNYLFCLLFFILGLLTKEQVILLPALIFLVELIFISKKFNKKSAVNVIKLVAPLFLISIIYFVMRLTVFDFNDLLHGFEYDVNYNSSAWYRLLTFASVMIEYFKLLFAPIGLHMAREVE
ncbi:MAG: hypothetical protein U9R14_04090, partial [Patescibacteria group bacterium]|nr:hypothetical protein [Patescibacteria group bacterium]